MGGGGLFTWGKFCGAVAQPLHHPLVHPTSSNLGGEGAPSGGLQVQEEQSGERISEQEARGDCENLGTPPPPCKHGEDAGCPSVCELGV